MLISLDGPACQHTVPSVIPKRDGMFATRQNYISSTPCYISKDGREAWAKVGRYLQPALRGRTWE